MQVTITEIKVLPRRRALNPAKVAEIAASMKDVGLINPITVSKEKVLIAGWHRLEGAKLNGWVDIECNLVEDSLNAELMEIDENLVRNELTVLEQGEHIKRRDEILTEFGLRALSKSNPLYSEQNESTKNEKGVESTPIPKTTKAIGLEIGLSESVTKQRKQIATNIIPEVKDKIINTPLADKTTDLLKLARMTPAKQIIVMEKITKNPELKVSQASAQFEREEKLAAVIVPTGHPAYEWGQIYHEDYSFFVNRLKNQSIDLLITDPPYITDVDDIELFVIWIRLVLPKLKSTGQAYIFAGAYPREVNAYLTEFFKQTDFEVTNLLVWTYRNNIGPSPKDKFKSNWQIIFYLRGPQAPPLDTDSLNELFSVKDFPMPDGRQGNNFFKWQKPDTLAEQLIRLSSQPGQLVIDPFAGSGTFLIKAAEMKRIAKGCEKDEKTFEIALSRGCEKGE